MLTAESGRVSRVTPVHTAMRNCTRDEGRSFGFGNQVLISSHRKLLWSKAMVVSVAEKAVDVKSLHAKIGQLTLENDFLEGALSKAGLLSARR